MKNPGKKVFVKFLRKYIIVKNKAKQAMESGDINGYITHLLEAQEAKSIASRTVKI